MNTAASLTTVARHLLFVRETEGPNRGFWVSFFQRFCGGREGDSWCCDFVSVVLDLAYKGKPPVRRTASCQLMLSDARIKGFVVAVPQVDDLYFFIDNTGRAHHVGIITQATPSIGIAGNTSEDGTSSNGTGVFEHLLSVSSGHITYVRLPKGL